MKCPDCGRDIQLKGAGCACDELDPFKLSTKTTPSKSDLDDLSDNMGVVDFVEAMRNKVRGAILYDPVGSTVYCEWTAAFPGKGPQGAELDPGFLLMLCCALMKRYEAIMGAAGKPYTSK